MCAVFHRLSRSGTDASEPDSDLNCEMDSHADTVAAGRNFVLYDTPSRTVNVHAYSEEYKPITDIPIATVATVWIDESNGQPYLLIFHEALFFGDRLSHSLICPNQLRAQGLTVHDTPQQFDPTSTHSIQVHDPLIIIPLRLKGVVSCFPSITPTDDDLEKTFVRVREDRETHYSLRWIFVHLLEHEAEHKGQIMMIKRLLKGKGKRES